MTNQESEESQKAASPLLAAPCGFIQDNADFFTIAEYPERESNAGKLSRSIPIGYGKSETPSGKKFGSPDDRAAIQTDLAVVIEAWPFLTDEAKTKVLATVWQEPMTSRVE